MRIRNDTRIALVVALRGVEGYDDREELLQPGQTSDGWANLEDDDVIMLEEVSRERARV